jgi:hypothetical protein
VQALRVNFVSTSTATFYENVVVNKEKKKLRLELMFKSKATELKRLKRFGEMYVVTTKAKIQGKLNDRETVCVFSFCWLPEKSFK